MFSISLTENATSAARYLFTVFFIVFLFFPFHAIYVLELREWYVDAEVFQTNGGDETLRLEDGMFSQENPFFTFHAFSLSPSLTHTHIHTLLFFFLQCNEYRSLYKVLLRSLHRMFQTRRAIFIYGFFGYNSKSALPWEKCRSAWEIKLWNFL